MDNNTVDSARTIISILVNRKALLLAVFVLSILPLLICIEIPSVSMEQHAEGYASDSLHLLSSQGGDNATDYFIFPSEEEVYSTQDIFYDIKQHEVKPEMESVTDYNITSSDGNEIRIRLFDPGVENKTSPVLIYVYGGGGNMEFYDSTFRHLANSSSLKVVTMEYRQSSEAPLPAPFPLALNDVVSAVLWISENGENRY
jgi:alpha/beta hydrolase fold